MAIQLLLFISVAQAESSGDFLLFPQLEAIHRLGIKKSAEIPQSEIIPAADFFATFNYDHFRFLGEALVSTDEQELERIQIGWLIEKNTFWLGRFHNPLGYWNTQFHHGNYLQTAATRPSIVGFEDDGSPLPMHITGLLIEGSMAFDDDTIGYSFSAGIAPQIGEEGLHPFDPIRPRTRKLKPSVGARLFYQSGLDAENQVGVFANFSKITANELDTLDNIDFITAGMFGNWNFEAWRLLGEFYYVHNQMNYRGQQQRDANFISAYLQSEYQVNDAWTLYARLEGRLAHHDNPYLALFPDVNKQSATGGVRFDLLKHHALKLEFSAINRDSGRFGQISLEWNAVFP